MLRVHLVRGGAGRRVNGELDHVELVRLLLAQVVGQVHVAVVQQALGYPQVLTLVAVQHGELAEVEGVAGIDDGAGHEQQGCDLAVA